jgi:hypothetical protein
MQSEMAKGENPELTSLVGASAAPSHAPAASPQITSSEWREPEWRRGARAEAFDATTSINVNLSSVQDDQQSNSPQQDEGRDPELHIAQDGAQ